VLLPLEIVEPHRSRFRREKAHYRDMADGKDVDGLIAALIERDEHLEDFLRTCLPAESGVATGFTTDGGGRVARDHREIAALPAFLIHAPPTGGT